MLGRLLRGPALRDVRLGAGPTSLGGFGDGLFAIKAVHWPSLVALEPDARGHL